MAITLQQLRVVCEVVVQDYNVSRAAMTSHTSQPAVSKMIRSLEQELGADIFVRAKGRLSGLTELGVNVYALARRMLHDAASLSEMAAESFNERKGRLKIATTHLHARYALVPAITKFASAYSEVDVELTQQDPAAVMALVATGECHLGLSTVPGKVANNVVILPAYKNERCVITPLNHPLLRMKKLTLANIAKFPLVAYDDRVFASARVIMDQFEKNGLEPRIALKATDADVIKTAVAAGLGISVFQKMAIDSIKDKNLAVIDARNLFPMATVYISLRRGQYLRGFTYDFIARLAPQWTKKEIEQKLTVLDSPAFPDTTLSFSKPSQTDRG